MNWIKEKYIKGQDTIKTILYIHFIRLVKIKVLKGTTHTKSKGDKSSA